MRDMDCLNQEQSSKILNLVKEVEKLNDVERLLLYLQLPCGRTEIPEGKYKSNNSSSSSSTGAQKNNADIFSKKSDQETTQTYTWILSHLEEDPNVSLPKQEVYEEYRAFCQANRFEPLCVADFGKAMKHALPCIKPRRLGQRGNSRYCYSGLRKKYKIEAPSLPNLTLTYETKPASSSCSSPTTEHHYPSLQNGSSKRAKVTGCNSSCQYDYPATPAISTCTASSSRPKMINHCKVMNMKIELCTSAQSQCRAPALLPDCCKASVSSRNINCPSLSQQQPQPPPPQPQQQQQLPQLTVSNDPYQVHRVPTNNHYQHPPTPVHRCGTPDDDEYSHNYHDLNRTILAPVVVPHTQNVHGQMAQQVAQSDSFISFPNSHSNSLPTSIVSLPLREPLQQQMLHRNKRDDHSHHKEHQQQQPQHPILTNSCCREQLEKTNIDAMTTSDSHVNNNQQHFISSDGSDLLDEHDQQVGVNNHGHTDHELHLSSNLLDHCIGSNMEYCTSPFQSPASTPYPIMNNYPPTTVAQDTHDYYTTDCPIQYAD